MPQEVLNVLSRVCTETSDHVHDLGVTLEIALAFVNEGEGLTDLKPYIHYPVALQFNKAG